MGKPATVKEGVDGCLKVIDTGPSMVNVTEELDGTFLHHLQSYGVGMVLGRPAHTGRYQVDARSHAKEDVDVSDGLFLHQAVGTKCLRRRLDNPGQANRQEG